MKLAREHQIQLLKLATAQRAADIRDASREAAASPVSEEQATYERLRSELKRQREATASAQLAVADMESEILRIQEDERKLKRRDRDDREQLAAELDRERRRDLEHDRYTVKSRLADLYYELKEAHNEIHALRNNRDRHESELAELSRRVDAAHRAAAAAPVVAEPAGEGVDALRQGLPPEVLAEYDARREDNAVGAAEFNGRSCGGCFVVLPPAFRQGYAKASPARVEECPECGSLLIRREV
ncbi:Zn-ribbon protein [Corynebacterium uterequi]|uniref:Zn-ribbon protein, possibly nucleic acid-binding n=1 Tax=Corynebacterium uterequi TaxID=1072256 RepID=A0A0G3HE05_9CORY|nr:Zn-ribbon protein [Corynebacterium uterequi]AKK11544.1 Zn-ribbon protein, possibly nucleic acid-binding [Corynebacterium uterequi]